MLVVSSLLISLGVALGAVGAHALKSVFAPDILAIFEKAVFYQITMSLGLFALSLFRALAPQTPALLTTGTFVLLAGIVLFSGSLYLYCFTGNRLFAMITPIGGIMLIISWSLAALSFYLHGRQ